MCPDKLSCGHCHNVLGTPPGSNSQPFHRWTLLSICLNLFFTNWCSPSRQWYFMFLLRPWHTCLTGLGPSREDAKSYCWFLKDHFLFYALYRQFLCLGVSPTAPSSQWKSSTLPWGPSSNVISLNPYDGWHNPLHFILLQMPLMSNPQVEV